MRLFHADAKTTVHSHEDDLEMYARGRLEPEFLSVIENHLFVCEICQKRLADCVRPRLVLQLIPGTKADGAQRRAEPRFNTAGEATLQELHPLSMERQKVKIVNVSKNGLGIVSPKAIFPGTIVQLRINDSVELGNVRYCSGPSDDGFRIGLRLHGEG